MNAGSDRLFDPGLFEVASRQAPSAAGEKRGPKPGDRIIRVLPDLSGLGREFDYVCPARWAEEIAVGSLVRFDLNRRRVAGWVTEVDITPVDISLDDLVPISKVSSIGPPGEIVELARWAAWRWHGRLAPVLKAASPSRMIRNRPESRREGSRRPDRPSSGDPGRVGEPRATETSDSWMVAAASNPAAVDGTTCFETSPTDDPVPLIRRLGEAGGCLVIVPDVRRAAQMAGRLRRAGIRVHLQPNQWSGGFTGGVVIGARSAVWAPVADLRSVVVVDEHDESLQAERVPTWHARDVAVERARRAGVPCLLLSPVPSLAARRVSDRILTAPRSTQRRGWPIAEVIDRRDDELGFSNLFSSRLVELLRPVDSAVLVLNRKGRARLLACRSCGELVRTEDGEHVMIEDEGGLVAPVTGERRPLICAACAGTALKRLHLGVGRAAEQLTRLLGRPVTELSGSGTERPVPTGGLILGTEAALHAVDHCDLVGFLDFDQELLAARYRAGEQALALLAMAARLVGGRGSQGRLVIQTRVPGHRVIRAAVAGDPDRFTDSEAELRAGLGFPPFGALAEISGVGATVYAIRLSEIVEDDGGAWSSARVLGPRRDGRYLVSVPESADQAVASDLLADLLAAVPRPKERVRIAVDPPRV